MKRVLFVGNRNQVWKELLETEGLEVVLTLAVEGSFLHRTPELAGKPHRIVNDKQTVLEAIAASDFDLLVSNGCPFILPITRLQRPGRLFVNIHPSLLPHLRGKHPVNGGLLLGHRTAGATMHFMDDGVDTGRIIAQKEIEITPDLDLGLLYFCLFRLEADAFRAGIARLRRSNFTDPGDAQSGEGSYYSRQPADSTVDLAAAARADFLHRVRAFGHSTQGVHCTVDGKAIAVIAAEPIDHPYLTAALEPAPAGALALAYDGNLVVRCRDGLVKITRHRALSS